MSPSPAAQRRPRRPPRRLLAGRRRELRARHPVRPRRARDRAGHGRRRLSRHRRRTPGATGKQVGLSLRFRVDTPYPTGAVPPFPNPRAAPADYQSFATLPGVQAPILTVTVPDRDPAAGDVLTTNGPGPGQYGPLIYTPQGRLVWFDRLPGGEAAEDLNVQTYAGRRDLTWWRGRVLRTRLRPGRRRGHELQLPDRRQGARRQRSARPTCTSFQLAPHGVAYITAYNPIRCNLSPLGGARDGAIIDTAIQEIDMATGWCAGNGTASTTSPPRESETPTATNTRPWDWFHINSIDVEGAGTDWSAARAGEAPRRSSRRAARGPATSSRRQRPDPVAASGGLKSSFKMGQGHRNGVAARRPRAPRRRSHVLRRRLQPADPPPVARRADRARLRHPRSPPRLLLHPPQPAAAGRQPGQHADAGGRRGTVVGYGGVPAISEYARGRRAAVRCPSALRNDLLPGLSLPLERAPGEPAGGARQPQRHERRDDRARKLERRHRSGRVARARGQTHRAAGSARHDPRQRLRKLDHAAR